MPDYKILKVSSEMPRTWGENAMKTYYIKCMLEGHTRPVEVGKKKPDALSPGMVLHGDIIDKPQFEADGFKADASAFGGQQSFGGGSKPSYGQKSDEQQESIARSVALKAAVDYQSALGTKSATEVLQTADVFLHWLQNSTTTSSEQPKHNVAQSSNEWGDSDEDFSALSKGLQSEGLSPEEISQIPF